MSISSSVAIHLTILLFCLKYSVTAWITLDAANNPLSRNAQIELSLNKLTGHVWCNYSARLLTLFPILLTVCQHVPKFRFVACSHEATKTSVMSMHRPNDSC